MGAGVALVVAALIAAWLVVDRGDSTSARGTIGAIGTTGTPGPIATGIKPAGLSARGLKALAGVVGQPIYWAGPRAGYLYELSRTTNGSVYIRYLPPGFEPGAEEGKLLIVATYPLSRALDALKKVSGGRGIDIPGGGLALVSEDNPKSVHVAFPKVDYQIEVFDPAPGRALEAASSGQVRPVT